MFVLSFSVNHVTIPQIPRILRLAFNSLFSLAHLATIANLSGVVNVEPETLLGAASDFSLKLFIIISFHSL